MLNRLKTMVYFEKSIDMVYGEINRPNIDSETKAKRMCKKINEKKRHSTTIFSRSNTLFAVNGKVELNEKPCLVYVKYLDHVEFRNADPSLLKPCVREVVGWLVRETEEAICLCHDMAVKPLPFEKPTESGFIILKSDILDMRRIEERNRSDL